MSKTRYKLLWVAVFFISCNNSTDEDKKEPNTGQKTAAGTAKAGADTLNSQQNRGDTVLPNKGDTNGAVSVSGWKTDDFIVKQKDRAYKELRRTVEYEREQWKNVANPLIVTFRGTDMGDYFHLNFEDKQGRKYDFGFGNNDYGQYRLFDKDDFDTNPEYMGKSFRLYWNWKVSTFPCCDGEYYNVEAYLPSITRLELIEGKGGK